MKGEDHQIQELVTRSGGTLKRTMRTAPHQGKINIKVNFGPLSRRLLLIGKYPCMSDLGKYLNIINYKTNVMLGNNMIKNTLK